MIQNIIGLGLKEILWRHCFQHQHDGISSRKIYISRNMRVVDNIIIKFTFCVLEMMEFHPAGLVWCPYRPAILEGTSFLNAIIMHTEPSSDRKHILILKKVAPTACFPHSYNLSFPSSLIFPAFLQKHMGSISSSQARSGLLLQDWKDVTPSPCAVTRIECVSHRTIPESGTHRTPGRCAGLAEHTRIQLNDWTASQSWAHPFCNSVHTCRTLELEASYLWGSIKYHIVLGYMNRNRSHVNTSSGK